MELFFELIQVAIGNRTALSHTPTEEEWQQLFAEADRHTLLGICFAGVKRLGSEMSQTEHLSEDLFFEFMGVAAYIQQQNDLMFKQCVELQKKFHSDGIRSCILKGQGVGLYYGIEHGNAKGSSEQYANLVRLRQPGDIDVWAEGGFEKVMTYVNGITPCKDFTLQHVRFNYFTDTEVEVHYTPIMLMGWRRNRKLQRWFQAHAESCFENRVALGGERITVPTLEFNLIYLLTHIYRHVFVEGIGLRQIQDYYFALLVASKTEKTRLDDVRNDIQSALKEFGLWKFARGLMYVIGYVFGLEREYMICEPNEKEGRFLLREIMMTGNFGSASTKQTSKWKPVLLMQIITSKMHLLTHYPMEVLSTPSYLIWHYVWKHVLKRKWLK